MRWEQQVQYASVSDVGFRRKNNQDSSRVNICPDLETWQAYGHLFLVADGMGGHAVGELASKIATDTLPHTYYKTRRDDLRDALKHAIEVANAAIYERGTQNHEFQRMGTTCSALVLSPGGAIIGHVGDSRVYRVRGQRLDQLTFDHSLQWELIRQGRVDQDEVILKEPRHVITRSLGPEANVEIDMEGPYVVLPGDTFILCSDGLTAHVHDPEIGTVAGSLRPAEASRLLVNLANLRGGSDNITAIVVRVGELPQGVGQLADDPAKEDHAGLLDWGWLTAYWAIAGTLVLGILIGLFGMGMLGAIITSVSVVAAGMIVLWWLRNRPKQSPPEVSQVGAETVLWRPYRTAPAKLETKFLSHLAAVESELQRTASEERWQIDWPQHESAYRSAKQSLAGGNHPAALGSLALAIDVLMAGLHLYRKQVVHERKWGKTPQPTNRPQQA
ncbi:MAG: protein phosphatase 2C domain-containing protein [Planctomycetaceae bacterium]